MNKIYKVVWSKVKNCYVVVSELAKNIITGSVKSAKIGSTPMAKGLALGAVMAFVITGSAMAAEEVTGKIVVNNSVLVQDVYGELAETDAVANSVDITASNITGNVFAGWANEDATNNTITVTSGSIIEGTIVAGQAQNADDVTGIAEDNKVYVENSNVTGAVYGGDNHGDSDVDGNVSCNEVKIVNSTVGKTVFGGVVHWADSDAIANKTTVTDSSIGSTIAGGHSSYGNANQNELVITGGTSHVQNSAFGGRAQANGSANENRITIEGATITGEVYGGSAVDTYVDGWSKIEGVTANDNVVGINGAIVNQNVYGGWSKADATGNEVSVNGATIGGSIIGGRAQADESEVYGESENNIVYVENSKVAGAVYGGENHGDGEVDGNVTNNEIRVVNSSVASDVSGGVVHWADSDAVSNKATIENSAIGKTLTGGHSSYGNANQNELVITGSTSYVQNSAFGGRAQANGSANENSITVGGGTITGSVYGGSAVDTYMGKWTTINLAEANKNEVTITDGAIGGNVYGGYSKLDNGEQYGVANENTVTITGGTIGGTVYAGYGGKEANDNTINVSGDADVENTALYGSNHNNATGNTLNIGEGWQGAIGKVQNFNNININEGAVATFAHDVNEIGATVKVDNATWNVAGDSVVTTLAGNNGNIVGIQVSMLADDEDAVEGAKKVSVTVTGDDTKAGSAVTNENLNIEGVDLVIDTQKTAIYNQDITIKSDSDVTVKSQAQGISAYGEVDIQAKNVTIESVDNGIQSVADKNPNDVGNVSIKAEENVSIKATTEGYAVTNVSKNGGVIDIEGKDVTLVSENRTAVKVGHEVGNKDYNGTLNVTGETITIEGAAQDPAEGNERKGSAVYAQSGTLNLNATDKLTITDTANVGGNAIGVYDGGSLEATAGEGGVGVSGKVYVAGAGSSVTVAATEGNVEIGGQVEALQQTAVDISGKNVTLVNDGGADTVRGVGATINITADEDINITTVGKDGIQACASDITLTAKNVVVDADAWGINVTGDAGSDVTVNAETIEIKGEGAADGDVGGIRNLGASNVTVTATENVKVTGDVYATGDGAKLTVDGGKETVINGAVKASGSDAVANVDGKNITVTLQTDSSKNALGVRAEKGATINLGGESTENIVITAKAGEGKLAVGLNGAPGGEINVNSGNLTIDVDGSSVDDDDSKFAGYGIYASNNTVPEGADADTDYSDNGRITIGEDVVTRVTVGEGGIGVAAQSMGVVDIKGDLYVKAQSALSSRGDSKLFVNSAGNEDTIVQLDGDIEFSYAENSGTGLNSEVTVKLMNEQSYLNGNIYKSSVPDGVDASVKDMSLTLANGATWTTDDESFVNELTVNDANIVIENAQAGSITVDTLAGTGMYVELASGEAEVGTIVVGEEKDDVRVSVTTSGVNMNAADAKGYKGIVQVGTGEDAVGIVDEINANNTYISGDVKFEADENGDMQVVSTTLNGDVNVTGNLTANKLVATNGASIATEDGKGKFIVSAVTDPKTGETNTMLYGKDAADNYTVGINAETGGIESKHINVGNGAFVANETGAAVKGGLTVNGNQAITGGLNVGTDVVANGTSLKATADQVATNTGVIADNKAAIEDNKQAIADNKAAIEDNKASIKDNADNIAVNAGAIADNKAAIEQNASDIQANRDAIQEVQNVANQNAADIAENKAAIAENAGKIQANTDAINQEIANRVSADAELQANIDAEAQARQNADIALNDKIENVVGDIADTKAQVEDNKAAIEQNAQDIANETADRVAADNKLQANLDKESVDRQIADAQERADRAQADQELQANIDAEAQARQDADAQEAKTRADEDQRLEQKIDGEVNSLNNRIDKVDAKIDKVGAMAAAMASLKTMGYDPEAPTEIAVGIGQYRNETGIAIGAFHYPNKNFMLNFSLSTAGDEVMGGIGATWKIGRKR